VTDDEREHMGKLQAALLEASEYNQRLLAENVRLTNDVCAIGTRASMDREDAQQALDAAHKKRIAAEDEAATRLEFAKISGATITELRGEAVRLNGKIATMNKVADVLGEDWRAARKTVGELTEQLNRANAYIDGQDLRSDYRTAGEMRAALDALKRNADAALVGSGCTDVCQLRVSLDASKAREESYRADVVRLTAQYESQFNLSVKTGIEADTAEQALDCERSRADVLAAECGLYRKYQAAADTCGCHGDGCQGCDDTYDDWQQARKHTDSTNALDPAKFEVKP
jgi:hypothetical protein